LGFGFLARRLGEAILEMLKALRGLGFEASAAPPVFLSNLLEWNLKVSKVQTRFCESVAQSLLPYLEDRALILQHNPKLQGI